MKTLLLSLLLALSLSVSAKTLLKIEEPSFDAVKQGVSTLRGWAVGDEPIVQIVYFIDGVYQGEIPYGGIREDIGEAFGDKYPNANKSGYAMAIYWGAYSNEEEHLLEVAAVTWSGTTVWREVTFNVTRFNEGDWHKNVGLEFTYFKPNEDNSFTLKGIAIGGTFYQGVTFEWSDATQGFIIVDIQQ